MRISSKLVNLLFISALSACNDADPETETSDSSVVESDASLEQDDAAVEEDAGPPTESASFSDVYAIFTSHCLNCHGASSPRGGLDLSTQSVAYAELTTPGDAQGGMCMGAGRKRVIASDPDQSLLIKKLENTQDCGGRMPAAAQGMPAPEPLSSEQIATVRDWISAGAMDD